MEENKESIKIKLTTAILLFIVLILVIIGIFYFYSNFNGKINEPDISEKESLLERNEVIENNASITTQVKQLDLNSDLVKKLYNYILKYSDYEEKLVYQSQKVTNDTIDNKLKLMTIFENLTESEADEVINKNEYGIDVTHTIFKKETIEKKAKEIFGNSANITHEECPIYFTKAIDYKNGTYDCYSYQGGGDTPWEQSTCQIKKAEQKDNEIYLYDQYVHVYDDIAGTTSEEGIYTTSDKKTKISDLITVSANKKEELFNKYEEKLGNKIQTFKHTFKKNSDGTYYWFSTEPINSENASNNINTTTTTETTTEEKHTNIQPDLSTYIGLWGNSTSNAYLYVYSINNNQITFDLNFNGKNFDTQQIQAILNGDTASFIIKEGNNSLNGKITLKNNTIIINIMDSTFDNVTKGTLTFSDYLGLQN